jgi:hypothetical protein
MASFDCISAVSLSSKTPRRQWRGKPTSKYSDRVGLSPRCGRQFLGVVSAPFGGTGRNVASVI